MTQLDTTTARTSDGPGAWTPEAPHRPARLGLFRDLDRPSQAFSGIGPNWYASVMGTGIVGVAAAALPVQVPGLHTAGVAVWLLAAFLLVALTAAWTVHWVRHTGTARGYAHNPVMAQFWGAVAMGVMTVGAGSVTFGEPLVGHAVALGAGWVLWGIGTLLGLVTAAWIPYMMIVHHEVRPEAAFAGWLMPVVPPMVSAANGAALVGHAPAALAPTMLVACYAMFGAALFATLALLPQIWNRLVVHGTGPAATVPTMWIVLGPLGQSVTAANQLGDHAGVLGEPYATGAHVLGVLYGVPAWGFAMLWLALAAAVTIRTARRGLPFTLTWWSFTFPVGTCVTGTSALAVHLHLPVLAGIAVGLYVLLVVAWLVVAARTAHGSLVRGHLLLPA
ncbi:TDT family transporter [Pseudonocardia phyllosphaerae]|uniref:TDT family transporter n=1 Tax=Pseudonocardia phyllosphaerae TaxID=3390502 RepID=UPI003978841C